MSTRLETFFKSHLFYLEVHDSLHDRFDPLLYERSVRVRAAFVLRGHKRDFYFKTTLTVFLSVLSASELTDIRH